MSSLPTTTQSTYSLTRLVWVTFQRVGFHRYPNAPEDVSYLASRHRHVFKFKVSISVTHNERELEYHQLLNWMNSLYETAELDASDKSCESLAEELITCIIAKYPDRVVTVDVSEDGECGSTLTATPV